MSIALATIANDLRMLVFGEDERAGWSLQNQSDVGLNHSNDCGLRFSGRLPNPLCDLVQGLCRFLENCDQECLLVLEVTI